MNQVHPTIMASLSPFIGSMGMFSNNPVRDAEEHFDALANTFETEICFHGMDLNVEVTRKTGKVVDIYSMDGTNVFTDFTDVKGSV